MCTLITESNKQTPPILTRPRCNHEGLSSTSNQIINVTIKIFIFIQDSESQLINKNGKEKLKNKLNAAAELKVSQLYLMASVNLFSE